MRLILLSVMFAIAMGFAFLLGRSTGDGDGDVIDVPDIAVRCERSQEGGAPRLICSHTPRPRYEVVFYEDDLFVYRIGDPDNPVFSAGLRP